ncbi:LPXTG cell wall anchor domain-containing protein [uncultured Ruminococcus sp.]|uniref:LPXTG cell wall anchor domain-containing protein n=1 Tax=uncultured Ruminococcus sp. TaxID=165186 RepID=UPI0026DD6DC4|nr:LPXTG cell wall anchor domain-containing protein [uncultured Ruminococcus sp.]
MKTTLKRTMAALSAAAIVATSAAVLAVPTSAAGGTATIGTVEVTVEEAKAGQIKVPVSVDNNFVKLSLGAEWDTSELDCTSIKCNSSSLALKFAYSEAYDFAWLPFLSTDADRDGNVLAYDTANGATVAYLIFDIKDADIQPGDTYTITAADTGRDGTKAQFENVNGDGGLTTAVSGAIVVKGEPTTEEPTTEAPTTEAPVVTTAATTTAAPKATTTAKAATPAATTTKKAAAASTSSPKTGDALPIAGVAVAVAVIGGVALVSKKRK